MDCRLGCGACCIAPSITTPIPGMPDGKPAGVRCIQLNEQNLCKLFGKAERPAVCGLFAATDDVCGSNDSEALWLISTLEAATN
ncbi:MULTISPECIES: YkgJ family cysteine cluster protein [Shewanella]|uniref:YkgJ family cysteine cluster protein n=1 Tax=Shewanella fidelis TaxID=173509 RepID=A0AAW8NRT2_9GAMM|nr:MULTISPECIES: YkgJ family cysteine cluster protein [Shewanella]MDR8525823.1 YkgJ family cysteine cluster protein [Shewanella fidelis]MDW4812668.1 YkgJ family cysteine cluster protein [Shewanella fidelis]MDW4816416.1 YkgJ family cysteine cluster protein [Shewanella fidelis]MDW4820420.1 YkgJ family cysteine cluster protein [Shewanella fidelis]MDW4825132.1 YkgJ family cysteine cluster protein [Shewanella fidelis]